MARFLKNRSAAQGKSPGSLVFIGKQKTDAVSIRLIQYHEQFFEDIRVSSVKELRERRREGTVGWIDINGLHDTELIAQVGEAFDIHPLTLEDIVNTGQRPKAEEFEHYISIMIKMMRLGTQEEDTQRTAIDIQGSDFSSPSRETWRCIRTVRERVAFGERRHRKSGRLSCLYVA